MNIKNFLQIKYKGSINRCNGGIKCHKRGNNDVFLLCKVEKNI